MLFLSFSCLVFSLIRDYVNVATLSDDARAVPCDQKHKWWAKVKFMCHGNSEESQAENPKVFSIFNLCFIVHFCTAFLVSSVDSMMSCLGYSYSPCELQLSRKLRKFISLFCVFVFFFYFALSMMHHNGVVILVFLCCENKTLESSLCCRIFLQLRNDCLLCSLYFLDFIDSRRIKIKNLLGNM